MPAQFVPGAVPVLPNSSAKALHFEDELLTAQCIKIIVHDGLAR
jgi:hypothetical protein